MANFLQPPEPIPNCLNASPLALWAHAAGTDGLRSTEAAPCPAVRMYPSGSVNPTRRAPTLAKGSGEDHGAAALDHALKFVDEEGCDELFSEAGSSNKKGNK